MRRKAMSSLFQVSGQLINVFVSPKSTNQEGKEYGGDHKIQLLGDIAMSNGETRKEMITLKVHDVGDLQTKIGGSVTAPIGVFAKGSNITYYIPKGSDIAIEAV